MIRTPNLNRFWWIKLRETLRLLIKLFSIRMFITMFKIYKHRKMSMSTAQDMRIKHLIDFCYSRVPYYKSTLREAAVNRHVEFAKLPILSKVVLRQNFPDFLARSRAGILFGEEPFSVVKTNGSTGIPCSYLKSRSDLLVNISSLTSIFNEYRAPLFGQLYDLGLHWTRQLTVQARMFPGLFVCWHFRGHTFDKQDVLQECRSIMAAAKPDIIYGVPSRIVGLAKLCQNEGIILRPKLTITTYEHLLHSTERLLREVFKCPIVNIYGTSETGIAGWTCRHGRIHFDPKVVAVELLKANGEYSEPGEIGKIILTPLDIRTMPLLRFDTGDLAIFPKDKCKCGKNTPSIENLEGREALQIETASGKSFSPFHVYGLIDSLLEATEYQIIQERAGALEVVLSCDTNITVKRVTYLKDEIRKYLGEHTEINVSTDGKFLYTTGGKRNAFVQRMRSEQ